jgi:hypothetical protein
VGILDRHDRVGLGQLDDDLVAVAQHRGVGHLVDLVPEGPVQLGHPVAEGGDPKRGDGVEVALPVDVDRPRPWPGHDDGALSP